MISEGTFTVTPILAILLVVGGALVLVFLIISTYLCVRKRADTVRRNRRKASPDNALLPQAPRGILINGGSNSGTNGGPKSKSTTHIPLNRDFDDCVMISDHNSVGSTERNPDIIPISKSKFERRAQLIQKY